ncbi:MAG: LemA family protein, partial [Alphaproteobacteria bacterium]
MSWTAIILLALAAVLLLWLLLTFNRFIRQRHRLNEAWSGIDVQLKRRADLIPILVETVHAYNIYERDLLSRVT